MLMINKTKIQNQLLATIEDGGGVGGFCVFEVECPGQSCLSRISKTHLLKWTAELFTKVCVCGGVQLFSCPLHIMNIECTEKQEDK